MLLCQEYSTARDPATPVSKLAPSTMSEYFLGPFGRMIPVTDGSVSDRESERHANQPVPTTHPYQLPPPRTSEPLPFLDPYPRQRDRGERPDSRAGLSSRDPTAQPNENRQLPSVSQLLIPPSHSSPQPPSPYHSQTFGQPTSNASFRDSPHSIRYDSGLVGPRLSVNERPQGHSEPFPRRLSGNLPPITHIHGHSPEFETVSQSAAHGSSPVQSYSHGPISYHSAVFQDQGSRGEMPSAESPGVLTPTRSHARQVRPHVVDERYIEGEGLCYVYADGSHCPKSIDGVNVNANWGITKAGKPRKRLAQACLTCREKKIKCQPNLPKCDQCQKSGRECRFESAPRGNRAALKASHIAGRYDARDSVSSVGQPSGPSNSLYSVIPASESSTSLPGTSGQSPVSEGSVVAPFAGDGTQDRMVEAGQPYRAKSSGVSGASVGLDESFRRPVDNTHASPDFAEVLMEIKDIDSENPLASEWNTDPYEAERELTTHYIDSYFTHVNSGLYHIFPRARFMLWVESCRTKSLDDKMLLYWMMALGAVFSSRPDRLVALKKYSRTARFAVDHSKSLSLQGAHCRIIMCLWYYAIGAMVESWDSVGQAVRTVCGLRYNVEAGGVFVDPNRDCEYGLHPQALVECRRRTFWVAFLMDRFSNYYSPSPTFIPSQMTFLRLPCREEIYEAQQYATVPYHQSFLDQALLSPDNDLSALSPMAFLIEIISLMGDVSHHVFRLSLIPAETYSQQFDEFYTTIVQRSEEWLERLPEHLKFTAINLETSIRTRKANTFFGIHLIYHAALMKLNRHARHLNLLPATVDRCIQRARLHAAEILRISSTLNRYAAEYYEASRVAMEPSIPTKWLITNPFITYVILSAVDVLSAVGLIADLPDTINLIRGGLETVRELGRLWDSALFPTSLIETRLNMMSEQVQYHEHLEGKVGFVTDGPSLECQVRAGVSNHRNRQSGSGEDLMYGGLPRDMLFRALGVDRLLFSEDRIFRIKESN